jgi:hypothetical protein
MNKKEISNHLIKLHNKLDNKVENIIENLNDELESCKNLISDTLAEADVHDGFEMIVKVVRGMKKPPEVFKSNRPINRYRLDEDDDTVAYYNGYSGEVLIENTYREDHNTLSINLCDVPGLISLLQKIQEDMSKGKL